MPNLEFYSSAVDENIDYYVDHPDKFTPSKIWKETWLPEKVRSRIAVSLYEVTGFAERKRRSRTVQRAEIQGVIAPKSKKKFGFTLDKKKISHKVDLKTGRFVKLSKSQRRNRVNIRRQGVKGSRQTTLKKGVKKG